MDIDESDDVLTEEMFGDISEMADLLEMDHTGNIPWAFAPGGNRNTDPKLNPDMSGFKPDEPTPLQASCKT